MKINLPPFLKSASIYTVTNFVKAAIPFFLLPILTSYLSTDEYGRLSMFQALAFIFIPLIGLNANSSIEREYFDNNRKSIPTFIANAIIMSAFSGLAIFGVFLIFKDSLLTISKLSEEWFLLLILFALSQNISEILLSFWKVGNLPKKYGTFKILRTILELSISIGLVVPFLLGAFGRIIGITLSSVFFSSYALIYLQRNNFVSWNFNWGYIKKMLSFGVPLIPHVIGGAILLYSDRFFITSIHGIKATGLYTVGYQIGMIIYLLQSSFNLAWTPWLYRKLNNGTHLVKLQIVKFTYAYFLFMIFCVMVLYLSTPIIFSLLVPNKSYLEAEQFVVWIGAVFAIDGMYKMVVNYIFYIKKTHIISLTTLMTAIINIILNYFFVTYFGPIGAAKASVIAIFIQFIAIWIISSSLYKMPWLFFIKGIK